MILLLLVIVMSTDPKLIDLKVEDWMGPYGEPSIGELLSLKSNYFSDVDFDLTTMETPILDFRSLNVEAAKIQWQNSLLRNIFLEAANEQK